MRFSIRGIFAITMLIALVIGAWINRRTAERDAMQLQTLRSELANLQEVLKRHGDLSQQRDKFRAIAEMEERVLEQFVDIRERYSDLKPVAPGVLAMRSLVELPIDGGHSPASFRLLVPAERPIWLRCAVLSSDARNSRPLMSETQAVTDSAFSPAEPFAFQLDPGERVLRIHNRPIDGTMLPIEIEVDGKVIMKTIYQFEHGGNAGLSHVSAPTQYNVAPKTQLPHLMTFRMMHENADGSDTGEGPYVLSIWLSERP